MAQKHPSVCCLAVRPNSKCVAAFRTNDHGSLVESAIIMKKPEEVWISTHRLSLGRHEQALNEPEQGPHYSIILNKPFFFAAVKACETVLCGAPREPPTSTQHP